MPDEYSDELYWFMLGWQNRELTDDYGEHRNKFEEVKQKNEYYDSQLPLYWTL